MTVFTAANYQEHTLYHHWLFRRATSRNNFLRLVSPLECLWNRHLHIHTQNLWDSFFSHYDYIWALARKRELYYSDRISEKRIKQISRKNRKNGGGQVALLTLARMYHNLVRVLCSFVFHFCCNLDSVVFHWILSRYFSTFQSLLSMI